jgi:ABC-type transport system involved in multi-copper enzyme maturation permease subunit
VFRYEWLVSARLWQAYALRSVFVLFLLVSLFVVWMTSDEVRRPATIRGLAKVGEEFYLALIGTQLTLVLLAAPAATAGAICLDRARGTLSHLLMTDLSDGEIVLGKLAARLVPVLGLVGCSLPVMALLTLLGGVDPDALFGAVLVTIGLAVFGCCLALVFSLWAGKTHEALLGTYAVWGLWLLATPMLRQINGAFGLALPSPPRSAEPFFLAFSPYWWPGQVSWSDYVWFLVAMCGLSAVLTAVAVLRVRSVCTRDKVARKTRSVSRSWPTLTQLPELVRRLPGPPLDFNPVFWREWHRSRPSRLTRIVSTLFVSLAVLFSVIAVISGGNAPVTPWVNGLQVSIGLLLLSVSASTSLAEERVRGSLDVLMVTPLSTREIVLGKWLGSFRLVPLLAILPALVVLCNVGLRAEGLLGTAMLVAFVIVAGAAISSLGLALATWVSRLGRAVGLTVTLYVLVTVGWLFIAMMVHGPGHHGEGLLMGSPFFWVGEMSWELTRSRGAIENFEWAFIWLIAYTLAAISLLLGTLATFDRCLGRVQTGPITLRLRELGPVELVKVERVAAEPSEVA